MTQTLDVRDEIEKASLSPRHWTIVFMLGLVTLFDGYDVFVPAYVIPYAFKEWGLQPSQAGLMVSFGLIGFMIGSLIQGPIADRIGRKPTLIAGLLIASLLNIATALWARSFESFLAVRLATGVGLGMLLPLAVTMINEIAPRRHTNILVGSVMVGWSAGGIIAALTGIALAPRFGWPSLFWAASVGIPLAGACVLALCESPRFLALQNRQDATRKVMSWLNPSRASAYAQAGFAIRETGAHKGSIARLFAPEVRRSTLVVWLCAGFSLFTIYGLSSWLPQSMIQRGESFGASFAFGALLQFMAVLGGLGCGWAADRYDRRTVLMASWIFGAAAIFGLALLNLQWSNIAFIAAAGFFIMGAQPVLNNLTAALYDTEIRSTGVGMELGVGRLGGILGPYVAGWLQQIFPGTLAMFLVMAAAVALSACALTLLRKPQVAEKSYVHSH